jgi:leukotriene-A4 hydrolase
MNTAASLALGLIGILMVGIAVAEPIWAASPRRTAGANDDKLSLDPHSFANIDQIRVSHLSLELSVDFEQRVLHGVAILDLNRQPGCPALAPLVLDTRGLTIDDVGLRTRGSNGETSFVPTKFRLSPADKILGSRLVIDLVPTATQVRIAYRTTPSAGALQWLEPSLTAGKAQPFLFSQSQAIHARSWIPLQDSPGVRVAYEATIRVPRGMTAVMAAESLVRGDDASQGIFHFVMPQAIPSYLIALAVGDLAFQKLSERTGVWAEPSVLKAAAYEFADVEAMVVSAEKLFGPYRWGRYDILVLPPSFPFGGMENPRLTFATPTVLAGDRSLVSLIAHELAHSWSGNLVTNATWRDFWLNEGFTTYFERRIVEDLYGRQRADMEAVLGLAELREELNRLPEKDQVLHIDLIDRDPDDGMTRVPYEKGALLLRTLERTFGRTRFDHYLRRYFDEHAFTSITTAEFEASLRVHLFRDDPDASRSIDLLAWLESPGLPADYAEPRSDRLAAIDKAAQDWLDRSAAVEKLGAEGWSTQEWLRFLHALPAKLTVERLAELDRAFGLTERRNSEIAHQWLLMAIQNQYTPADERIMTYLTTIGRRKLVLPLYRALIATPEGRKRAEAIYATARPSYHPITVESIDRVLSGRA